MAFETIQLFYYSNNSILGNTTNFLKKRKNICPDIEKMGNVVYRKREKMEIEIDFT